MAAEEQSGAPWKNPDPRDEDSDEHGRHNDETSLASYTIGGRCLQTHVKRIDDESVYDSEGENAEEYPIQEKDLEGHDADGDFPIEYPESATPCDLDGEPCA